MYTRCHDYKKKVQKQFYMKFVNVNSKSLEQVPSMCHYEISHRPMQHPNHMYKEVPPLIIF
jgi:hypothetical protein